VVKFSIKMQKASGVLINQNVDESWRIVFDVINRRGNVFVDDFYYILNGVVCFKFFWLRSKNWSDWLLSYITANQILKTWWTFGNIKMLAHSYPCWIEKNNIFKGSISGFFNYINKKKTWPKTLLFYTKYHFITPVFFVFSNIFI
jgi:hypothetical protein